MVATSPKARADQSRADLLKTLEETLRKVGAQSVLLSDTVAKIVGLHSTDLECLDLLLLSGPATAGGLSKHSGLTTGATTAVIDRLERAGLVRRIHDSEDRRRVMVEALPGSVRHIEPLYRRLAIATTKLNEEYDDRALSIVADYLTRATALCAEHVAWLQTQSPAQSHTHRRVPDRTPERRRTGSTRTSRRTSRASARRP